METLPQHTDNQSLKTSIVVRKSDIYNKEAEVMKKTRWFICGIYRITNPEKQSYIGQSKDIFARWGNTIKKSSGSYLLAKSFEKFGVKNHSFDILEECKPENLHKEERKHKVSFIEKNGWNSALFLKIEDDCPLNKERVRVKKYDLNGNFIEEFRSITEAAKSVNAKTCSSLVKCCKKENGYITHYGFQWRYADDDSKVGKVKRGTNQISRKCFLLNDESEKIQSFDSLREAEKTFGFPKAALSKSFFRKGNKFTYKKMHWLIV